MIAIGDLAFGLCSVKINTLKCASAVVFYVVRVAREELGNLVSQLVS